MRKTPKHQQTIGYLRIKHGELSIRNDTVSEHEQSLVQYQT